jgi:hypothetical protein
MVVQLLAQLKQTEERHGEAVVLILHLRPSSAKDIMKRSSTFLDVLPALWAYCREVVIVCQGEPGILEQLRRSLCGSMSTSVGTLAHPLSFFELLDDAFTHAQGIFPHEVLELRRQRIRSGMWPAESDPEQMAQ